jgi:hypothetical protein
MQAAVTRALAGSEISRLESQGCRADDWSLVNVSEGFVPDRVRGSWFSGEVFLGRFDGSAAGPERGGGGGPAGEKYGGPPLAGVFNSRLHSCRIDDNARVCNAAFMANIDVEEGAVVENVSSLSVEGETTFGNGVTIDVFNEAGGRTIKIFDRLSAQLAYLWVFYRHRPELIRRLEALVDAYVASKKSNRGIVGKNSRIRNCGALINVSIGPSATIEGAVLLENGTVASNREAPVFIGAGVIAKRFIVQSGSRVDDGALLTSSFVGQSVRMGKQYSAENSAFFANSELFHGEGCSVFAGPYTVTHHKSTLLIAGFFSFYNAGSGTNQSNHMYKLGPVHQGILERGSKTGSFSYLLWPSRVGAFTNVIGKHYSNFDTADLPFSFIDEEDGRSVVVPGMNLFTVGTKRDGMKWPSRDGRKDPDRLDRIHFEVLSPYTVGRMVRGEKRLRELAAQTPQNQEYVQWNGISVNRLMLKTSIKYYEIGIQVFLGNGFVSYLEGFPETAPYEAIRRGLDAPPDRCSEEWLDAAGLLASASGMQSLTDSVERGGVKDLTEFEKRLDGLHAAYGKDAFEWCVSLAAGRRNKKPAELAPADLMEIVGEWKAAGLKLNNMILQDAAKEFSASSSIGYGRDGGEEEKRADFEAVRGSFEGNAFVKSLKQESENIRKRAEKLIKMLERF